ncbi:MAG: four helix bundle protein [Bacteroidales bacterium]|nr:four helix bundle protein [Bacteroidales bacterium]
MKNTKITRTDLEDRLIDFSVLIIEISQSLPNTKAGNHISGQIIRSGTSPAMNYGEAQSAESRRDFIHKIKIVLKELRETSVGLKIIHRAKLFKSIGKIESALKECNELISIFVKSVMTAQKNIQKEKRGY